MFPEISIIIPAYNADKNISTTLDSVVRQTFDEFEVIIVDDGSTDNTREIVKQYIQQDSRIKYYYQENKGVSVARNIGINVSKGKYISFLDADDYYENTYLKKMHQEIIKTDSDVCYCGYNIIDYNLNTTTSKDTIFTTKNVLLGRIFGKINVHTTGWLIKKQYLQDNNLLFPEGVSWGEDFEFFCEVIALTDNICYVNEYLTNYLINHEGEQLSDFSLEKIDLDYQSIIYSIDRKS